MQLTTKKARAVRAGDQIVVTVNRVLGMQGRKPSDGSAALMRIEFADGVTIPYREDERVTILR